MTPAIASSNVSLCCGSLRGSTTMIRIHSALFACLASSLRAVYRWVLLMRAKSCRLVWARRTCGYIKV